MTNHSTGFSISPAQVRKIKATNLVNSGVLSFRGKGSIAYESPLERDFLIKTSFDPDVIKVIAQPVRLSYQADSGRGYPYTPDFLVYRRSGLITLVEVKQREVIQSSWRQMKPKFREALRYAKAQGWAFRIFDDVKIRDEIFERIKSLMKYKQFRTMEPEVNEVVAMVKRSGHVTLEQILKQLASMPEIVLRNTVWHLVFRGELFCDLSKPISDQTEIWWSP